MSKLTLDDLLDQLEQARQIAIEERKPSAMIQATITIAKLLRFDKGVNDADEVQPVSIMINMVDASKPERVRQ